MHRLHNEPRTDTGPQTTGSTIHWASHCERMTGLFGLGVNSATSRMVVELAEIKPGDRVLDVACGTGSLTLTAAAYAAPGGKVYGIDAAPEMIELARQKAARSNYDVTFEVGLAEDLAFPPASFEVVISRLAIHHLPDELKRKAFAEILRVLKPGGRLLIADFTPPANPILHHVTAALVGHRMMQANVSNLPGMLADAGFVQVKSGKTRSVFLAFVSASKPGG